jgi:hypothetical protein
MCVKRFLAVVLSVRRDFNGSRVLNNNNTTRIVKLVFRHGSGLPDILYQWKS